METNKRNTLSKLDHLESGQRTLIEKLIGKYNEVFSLDSEHLSCKNLTEYEIILKSVKIIKGLLYYLCKFKKFRFFHGKINLKCSIFLHIKEEV